jgi:hypothetical protein
LAVLNDSDQIVMPFQEMAQAIEDQHVVVSE